MPDDTTQCIRCKHYCNSPATPLRDGLCIVCILIIRNTIAASMGGDKTQPVVLDKQAVSA